MEGHGMYVHVCTCMFNVYNMIYVSQQIQVYQHAWRFKEDKDFMHFQHNWKVMNYFSQPADTCWKLIFVFVSGCTIFCQSTATTCTSPGESRLQLIQLFQQVCYILFGTPTARGRSEVQAGRLVNGQKTLGYKQQQCMSS